MSSTITPEPTGTSAVFAKAVVAAGAGAPDDPGPDAEPADGVGGAAGLFP
jgi:hypothetical protein